jgi:hypothetical protein
MALNPVDRESRTRREDAPSHYLAYLNSPGWRRTRNEALKRANYTCHRCGSRRDLNVHHRSYERLGLELPSDLEVLCFGCHNEHHREEAKTNPLGIYLKVVSEVLNQNAYAAVADISDAVKTLCAHRKIPVEPRLIAKAISLACATRLKDEQKRTVATVEADGLINQSGLYPFTHAEAVEFLARVGFGPKAPVKRMPRVKLVTRHEADKVKAFEMVTQEIMASIARCEALEQEAE